MKNLILLVVFALSSVVALAQEQAIYSQYQVLPVLINPAYTGFNDQHQLLVNTRSSWSGFAGSPKTYTLAYNGPISDKLALGGGIYSEKVGDMNTMKLSLSYAFRFRIQKAKIGLGLSTEFLRRKISNDLLTNDIVDKNDDVLEGLASGQQIFDATMGGSLLYDDRFFMSIALPNAVRTRLDDVPVDGSTSSSSLFEHYIFQLGYIADIASQNFKIIPSITIRQIRDTPYQIDMNVQGRFLDEKLIAGITFRPSDKGAAAFMIGTKFKQFQLFYTYDLSFSKFQQYSGGSHELSISYSFARKPKLATPAATEPIK
ncbi:MAG: type IX secretion system membrane protein PorP/SprF [Bacteroidetes bacterium]|nr:type IX secretion system membrane protein PorP/SprF [Bacteroidota bacterium]